MKRRFAEKNNVLLVNITRLGDMLQATPTIAGIKLENPNCKITVLVEKQFEEVCHYIPNIDEVIGLDLGMTVRSLAREQDGIIDAYEYISEVVDDLRRRNFDYCLNMSSSAYTALLLKLVGIDRNGGWTSDEEGYRVIASDWAKLFASSVFHQNRHYNSLNLVDIFRCSADVHEHPQSLLVSLQPEAEAYARDMIANAGFTNTGPLIAIQAGASQQKRQWLPRNFVEFINILIREHDARVVMTGSKKEMEIITPIVEGCNSPNVFVAAGKTSIPQLAALLNQSDILVTGDTGPMHVCVAAGTPVVSMFLASAFGFETGPYSEGNIVLQPVIGCGPCNPNKSCARPDCHDTFSPELLAKITMLRLRGDFTELPAGLVDPAKVTVYRSYFDEHGFCDLMPLNAPGTGGLFRIRKAYRQLWLDDLGGFAFTRSAPATGRSLPVVDDTLDGVDSVVRAAEEGAQGIQRLMGLIRDVNGSARELGEVNTRLIELDRHIEELGFHHPHLGPVTRMFVFAKENLSGTDAVGLASQMGGIYTDLSRRCRKLAHYYSDLQ